MNKIENMHHFFKLISINIDNCHIASSFPFLCLIIV